MKTLISILLFCSIFSCSETELKYYHRSEQAKLNDPKYQKMEKMFDSLSEEDKSLVEEIVMARLAEEQAEKAEYYFEPDSDK